MILNYIKVFIFYLLLKPWNTYAKFFFINATILFSYQTSWYVALVIYSNLFLISTMRKRIVSIYKKELHSFLIKKGWILSENEIHAFFEETLKTYGFAFLFSEKIQCRFFTNLKICINENFNKIGENFKQESHQRQWEYLISYMEHDSNEENFLNLFKQVSWWDLSKASETGIRKISLSTQAEEVIFKNLNNGNLIFFKGFGLSVEEIKKILQHNSFFIAIHSDFFNSEDADQFLKRISKKKKIVFFKNRIKKYLVDDFESVMKILNLTYLLDINLDVSASLIENNFKVCWRIDHIASCREKFKLSFIKQVLKKRYSDKKILELFCENKMEEINFQLIKDLVYLWGASFPDKVKKFSDFSNYLKHIQGLQKWKNLNIPKNYIERSLPRTFFYKNKFYHIHLLKRIDEFYSSGNTMINCLYRDDYFYRTYCGLSTVLILKNEEGTILLAIELNHKGTVVQFSGINYAKNTIEGILSFLENVEAQNSIINYFIAFYRKIYLTYWSMKYSVLKKITFLNSLFKISFLIIKSYIYIK